MLKWQSGRQNWYSVLELAHVQQTSYLDLKTTPSRRASSASMKSAHRTARAKMCLARDIMTKSTSAFREIDKSHYQQNIVQVINEGEVEPRDKIGDIGYRVVRSEEARRRKLEKKQSFRERIGWGAVKDVSGKRNSVERLLFKPIVARIVDRTNMVEVSLHYEQARSDFVSGHFRCETPPDLIIELVAMLVHSTAGTIHDLHEVAGMMGLPFIKLWDLLPMREYIPVYAYADATQGTWQSLVLAVMKKYSHLTPLQSRLAFLDTCAREFTFFGAHFYDCTVSNDTNILTTIGAPRILAVSPRGIFLLRNKLRADAHQSIDVTHSGSRVVDLHVSYADMLGWNLVKKPKTSLSANMLLAINLPRRRLRLSGPYMDKALKGIENNVAMALLLKEEAERRKLNRSSHQQQPRASPPAGPPAGAGGGASSSTATATAASGRRMSTHISESKLSSSLAAAASAAAPELRMALQTPEGWEAHFDPQQKRYFFLHKISGRTTWTLDEAVSSKGGSPVGSGRASHSRRGRGGRRHGRGGRRQPVGGGRGRGGGRRK